MKANYSIAFTNGKGVPTKLLNIPFFATPKDAITRAKELGRRARDNGNKNYGSKWGYAVVAVTPINMAK